MNVVYNGVREESSFILSDFNCEKSQELLQKEGYYKIIWNTGKTFIINVDGYNISIEENQILFCTPLNFLEIPSGGSLISVVFNREFYCLRDHDYEVSCQGLLFFGSSFPAIISINKKEYVSFMAMFQLFREEFEIVDKIQGEMLRVILKRLLIKSTRLITDEEINSKLSKPQLDLLRKYHVLVEKHFRKKHQVSEYADLLFKSPKTLSNLFKKIGNDSPLKIINNRIILEAKRLLLFSSLNTDEISQELGYKEAAHFSKFFKSHVGLPPSQFKEKGTFKI